MKTVETVSFILIKDNKVLVERRRLDRINDPGAVVVPGGHVEPSETHLQYKEVAQIQLFNLGFISAYEY